MAAEKIQQYYRRWRGRTMFQQLQRYRAAKHHDLVIFSHQVHIYGQEFFQYLSRNKAPVPLNSIAAVDRETARTTTDTRMKMLCAVRKIPLSRSLADFVDTTEMCTPHQPYTTGRGGRSRTPEPSVSPQPTSPPPCPSCQGAAAAAATVSPSPSYGRGPSAVPSQPRRGSGHYPASPHSGHCPSPASPHPGVGPFPVSGPPSPDPRLAPLEPGVRSGAVSPQFEFELPSCSSATVSETRAVFDRHAAASRPPVPPFSAPMSPSYPGHGPSYTVQTPSYQAPAQAYQAPPQAYQAPAQAYQAPAQAYQAPAQAYQAPAQAYQAPAQAYQAPAQAYQAPAQAYQAPAQAYQAPAQAYQAQAPPYAAPVPAPSYAAPPAPSYNRFAGSSHSSATQRPAPAAAGAGGGGSMWGKRWATTPAAPAPFVQELQDRSGRLDEEDAPPFNFQGMLKKTNVTRDSMKRGGPGAGTGQPANKLPTNIVITSYGAGPPTGYNAKKMRNRSTEEQTSSPAAPDGDEGVPAAPVVQETDTAGEKDGGLETGSSQNGSNGDVGRGTASPQIVFEGEEVEL